MRLSFFGAAGEVTGSCYLLETSRARVLVDFGLHQGGVRAETRNRRFPPVEPDRLDAVVLTHAHIDHSGRLPLLAREGYAGPIYATPATRDLCEIMLRDAAHIQVGDAAQRARRRARCGRGCPPPLYTVEDAERALALFRDAPFDTPTEVAEGVTARLYDAGHILGAASVELTVRDRGTQRVLVFSGDLGPKGAPLMRDPKPPPHADVLILESTYGDRDHRSLEATLDEFVGVVRRALTSDGKTLIPSFAVGRTQQLIYHFGRLRASGRLDHPAVYVDSPMAVSATELYRRHRDLFDDDARRIIDAGDSPLNFPDLHLTRSVEESRALNDLRGVVIVAASGMCTGGRILHHLRHNLWRPETTVLIVGYQAEGSLGRRLVDGARRVRVLGEPVVVKAGIHTLGGFSAHAGQSELIQWASAVRRDGARPRTFLTHGEDRARRPLAARLAADFDLRCELPVWRQSVELD